MHLSRASESCIERVAQPTSRPPTHARSSLARDPLIIATLKWGACSLSCLSQILTFRVLYVSVVGTGRLSKPPQSTLPRASKPTGLERSERKRCELRVNPGNFVSFCVMNCPSVFCVLSLDWKFLSSRSVLFSRRWQILLRALLITEGMLNSPIIFIASDCSFACISMLQHRFGELRYFVKLWSRQSVFYKRCKIFFF